jgi:hypothetical protein
MTGRDSISSSSLVPTLSLFHRKQLRGHLVNFASRVAGARQVFTEQTHSTFNGAAIIPVKREHSLHQVAEALELNRKRAHLSPPLQLGNHEVSRGRASRRAMILLRLLSRHGTPQRQ